MKTGANKCSVMVIAVLTVLLELVGSAAVSPAQAFFGNPRVLPPGDPPIRSLRWVLGPAGAAQQR
jgi:hypothetical protein